jgi:hypothetical protein
MKVVEVAEAPRFVNQTSRFVQDPIDLLSLSDVDVWSIRSRWSPVSVVSTNA